MHYMISVAGKAGMTSMIGSTLKRSSPPRRRKPPPSASARICARAPAEPGLVIADSKRLLVTHGTETCQTAVSDQPSDGVTLSWPSPSRTDLETDTQAPPSVGILGLIASHLVRSD
jgi:hypothetical protein